MSDPKHLSPSDTGLRPSQGPEYKDLIPQEKYAPGDVFKDLDPEVINQVRGLLTNLFQHLEIDAVEVERLAARIIELGESTADDLELETQLKALLKDADLDEKVQEKLSGRASRKSSLFIGYIYKEFFVSSIMKCSFICHYGRFFYFLL